MVWEKYLRLPPSLDFGQDFELFSARQQLVYHSFWALPHDKKWKWIKKMHPEFGPKKWIKCSIQFFWGRKNEKWIEKWMDKAPHPDLQLRKS